MSGHTPGPWEIVAGDEWTADVATVEGGCEDGRARHWNVASVSTRRDEWKANRRLIAAAPDLLNALRTLADAAESHGIPCDAARAAISKATGGVK